MKIVNISGGIGRVICSTVAINRLAEREPVTVITGWPMVFDNNPAVQKVYLPNHPTLWDDVISHGVYVEPEPYHDYGFYGMGSHLIQSFCQLVGVNDSFGLPELFLSSEEQSWAAHFRSTVLQQTGRQYLVPFHPFGAGYKQEAWGSSDSSHRSMSLDAAKALVDRITAMHPEILLFNATALPQFHPNVWQQTLPFRELFAAVGVSDFYLGVDSSTAHVAAAFHKPTVTMFGSTAPGRFGYKYDRAIGKARTYQKEGYPKSYNPLRFQGAKDLNGQAMFYGEKEIEDILNLVSETLADLQPKK